MLIHAITVVNYPERLDAVCLVFRLFRKQHMNTGCFCIVPVAYELLDGLVGALVQTFGEQSDNFIADPNWNLFDFLSGA